MKKTLLTTLCALISLFGMAQTEKIYNEPYVVSVNGNVEAPRQAEITIVDNGNGTLNFLLKDFVISLGGEETSVGDVCLEGVPYTEEAEGMKAFTNEGTYTIPADRLPAKYQMLADFFVDIPYTLDGAMTEEKLYAILTIDMSKLGQNISAVIGSEDFFQPSGAGKIYTEPLVVIVDGNGTEPQDADVLVVTNEDGTINFVLKNFLLNLGDNEVPVGNIVVENLPVTKGEDGLDYISFSGNIFIQPGDMPGKTEEDWVGPMLSSLIKDDNGNPMGIPVVLNGKMNSDKLFVTIDIELAGQVIHVQLGTDDFPKGKIYTEPLVVIVDGNGTEPQDADVLVVNNEDGTINFVLKNFLLNLGDNEVPVGNIVVENLPVTKGEDGLDYISFSGNIFIQPGDMPGKTEEDWVGPMLSSLIKDDNGNPMGIPVVLNGKMNSDKLFVTIDIELAGQVIHVQLGTDDFAVAIKGDFNGDMRVDAADAEYVLTLIAGNEYSEIADFNEDNEVNAADLEFILSIIAGK